MEGNISKLKEELPRLEKELELAIMRRQSLEREVERLTTAKQKTNTSPDTNRINYHVVAASVSESQQHDPHEQEFLDAIPYPS